MKAYQRILKRRVAVNMFMVEAANEYDLTRFDHFSHEMGELAAAANGIKCATRSHDDAHLATLIAERGPS